VKNKQRIDEDILVQERIIEGANKKYSLEKMEEPDYLRTRGEA